MDAAPAPKPVILKKKEERSVGSVASRKFGFLKCGKKEQVAAPFHLKKRKLEEVT